MPVPAVNKYYSTGDIFCRSNDSIAPAFFTDTVSIFNAGKNIYWPPGTPLTTSNVLSAVGLTSVQKLVYYGVTLAAGQATKVCVIDARGTGFTAPNMPVNFHGIKINLSKMPLVILDKDAANTPKVYPFANWRTCLSSGRLNVPFFEESTRFDPAQT